MLSWKRILNPFLARSTTVLLIAVLLFVYFLGLLIPQRTVVGPQQFAAWQAAYPVLVPLLEKAGLTRIYSSWYVLALTAIFFLNLLLVTLRRIPALLKESRLPGLDAVPMLMGPSARTIQPRPDREPIIGRLADLLQKRGYRADFDAERLIAVKNRFFAWGSILFHLSFFFFLAGGLTIFHTRFRGEAVVAEGQVFAGQVSDYRVRSRLSELRTALPRVRFVVEKIEPRFEKNEAISLKTTLRAEAEGRVTRGTLDVNDPLDIGTVSIMITDVGITPLFVIADSLGKEEFGAWVNLSTIMRGERETFAVPGTDWTIAVRFWPDAGRDPKGNYFSRSYELKNPLFHLEVRDGKGVVAEGTLQRGGQALIAGMKRVSVPEIRYHGTFLVIDESGGALLMLGFFLAIISLLLKLFWTRRTVVALRTETPQGSLIRIALHQEYYQQAARAELEGIIHSLEEP